MKRVHAGISGNVQGVGFRASTRRKARQLDLTGWVKNLPNGNVETVIEGPEKDVEEMLEWLKTGPSMAHIENIEVEEEEPEMLETFEIER
jgi:acylphosphatase